MISDFQIPSVDVVIPTYHPDGKFPLLLDALLSQTHLPSHIWIVNTRSESDLSETDWCTKDARISLRNISEKEFDHGATRNLGASLSSADYLLFMTQDAVPCNAGLIESLLKAFSSTQVAVAYARQVADGCADSIEKLTRCFNYPETDTMKSLADKGRLGIKTYFCSNVCAMYDRRRFVELGGFPERMIFNEDMLFAAKAINSGCYIAYSAEAEVFHSHRYTCIQQLKRYFDLAVSQKQNPFLFDGVSSEGEGVRLVRYVVSGLAKKGEWAMVPYFIWQSAFKYLGYFLGYRYELLPKSWRKSLSMNRNYWK
ncbi:MAG: glycosyltransferase [Paludibacteraceae bacterium]